MSSAASIASDDGADVTSGGVTKRMNSMEHGRYSAAGGCYSVRCSSDGGQGGTPRRLLVVLTDGPADDHGYERGYGAADARRALTEPAGGGSDLSV